MEKQKFSEIEKLLYRGIEVTSPKKRNKIYTSLRLKIQSKKSNISNLKIIIQKRKKCYDGPIIDTFIYRTSDIRLIYTNIYSFDCILYLNKNKYNRTYEMLCFSTEKTTLIISSYLKKLMNSKAITYLDVL